MSLQKDLKEIAALRDMFKKLHNQPTNNDPLRKIIKNVGEAFIRTQMEAISKRIGRHEREGRKHEPETRINES